MTQQFHHKTRVSQAANPRSNSFERDEQHTSQVSSGAASHPSSILRLQSTVGNQAVMRMLTGSSTSAIQRETQKKDNKPTLNQDMEEHMGQKLVSNWLGSNIRMRDTVNEAINHSVILAGHRDVDLGVRRELQKSGKSSLYKPMTSARDIGKQWWQSQQKIDTQSDKELGVANNWLDMLRDVETGSEETHK